MGGHCRILYVLQRGVRCTSSEHPGFQGHVSRQSIKWSSYVTRNSCVAMTELKPDWLLVFFSFPYISLSFPLYLFRSTSMTLRVHHHTGHCIPGTDNCCKPPIYSTPALLPFPVSFIVSLNYISAMHFTSQISFTPARFLTNLYSSQHIYNTLNTSAPSLTHLHNTSSLYKPTFTLKEHLCGSCFPCTSWHPHPLPCSPLQLTFQSPLTFSYPHYGS